MSTPRLVISGTSSGVGKTTVTLGLMAAFRRRGLRVAPFKVGPDYLDPGWHLLACGRPSAPLDTWMLGREGVLQSFQRGTATADLALIEGMMGLHDGADATTDQGSTAEVAKILQAPVALVLDGSALARSAGALALGYRQFDPDVSLAGVIANRVAGAGHASLLRPAIEEKAHLSLLGWIPSDPEAQIPERHLGLRSAAPSDHQLLSRLADLIEAQLNLDTLLQAARSAPPGSPLLPPPLTRPKKRVRLGVARDAAFSFYYPDNLELLENAGAELIPFSPLADSGLPAEIGGLYFGGGYPELHAAALSGNTSFRSAVRRAADQKLPIYAECGGLMYLCETLQTADGRVFPMVGLVPSHCVMEQRLQAIGYREVMTRAPSLLGPAGTRIRGHEFHHSRLAGSLPPDSLAFDLREGAIGFNSGQILASYVHLHFGSNPSAAEHFVRQCLAIR